MMLYDWQRGKIPFFKLPPGHTEDKPPPTDAAGTSATAAAAAIEAAAGALAEGEAGDAAAAATAATVFAEAVTEEDAAGEAGAAPENAAAAARAVREAAGAMLRSQRRSAIPVKVGAGPGGRGGWALGQGGVGWLGLVCAVGTSWHQGTAGRAPC
jgi:nuclear GTP-binding protein